MPCCTGQCAAPARFDAKVAERDLRRYKHRGPDASTRMLLSELRRWPLRELHLLDVGAGIGVIPVELANAGLARVTLADAAPAYVDAARGHVSPRYDSRPIQFILGDAALPSTHLPDADIVTLDRVVCCYPDVGALLRAVAARAGRLLAFTYHPDRWYLRFAVVMENFTYWIRGNPFRVFVHPPEHMAAVLEAAGFVRASHRESFQWCLDLYHRPTP
jgi:2-polyprenyl-3-methyl-5-hydroxy-6-metoxy-1,4-benzoquinol methylase